MAARRYAVLGGGALGLTVAMRLAERGDHAVVFEREAVPGGLAAGFRVGDVHLEKFYHHLFETDVDAVELIGQLGLSDRLIWKRPVTAVWRDGRAWQFDSPQTVLKFRPLPLIDRLRLGAWTAYLRWQPRYRHLSTSTASEWLRRRMGPQAYDVLWEPLLESKFGDRHDDIAMPWFWARIHYRTAALGYVRGGFQVLYDTLAQRIRELGSEVRLGAEVRSVRPVPGQLQVEVDGEAAQFDGVVSTLPMPVTCRIVTGLPDAYVKQFGSVEAYSALCLILALDRQLSDVYWLNLNDPGFPFQPLVEHTNFMSADDYGGKHLVYLGKYLHPASDLLSASTEEVFERFLPGLRKLFPDFSESWVTDSWLFKAPFAQPIVTREYASRIPPHVTPLPGLLVANMFQIFPQDRGQNYSIRMANNLVRHLM